MVKWWCLFSQPSANGTIAFTGSKTVGLQILKDAAIRQEGQPQVKRVICEMGGKNAIIVDDDADLDEAVLGVAKSAFGFAGQKCSACSRVFVVGTAYDSFKHRLAEATASLTMGPAHVPKSKLGPVVDAEAFERLQNVTTSEHANATLVHRGQDVEGGYYIPPTIFEVQDEKHALMQNEFFGPVVAIMKAASFDEAIAHANSTEYALTGAVYSRSPDNLDKARRNFSRGEPLSQPRQYRCHRCAAGFWRFRHEWYWNKSRWAGLFAFICGCP